MIKIKEEYCPKNHRCPATFRCPVGAIKQKNSFSAPIINKDLCTDCGICVRQCNVFAIVKE